MNRARIGQSARVAAVWIAIAAAAAAGCSNTEKEAGGQPPPRTAETQPNVTIKTFDRMGDVPLVAPDGERYRLSHFRGKIVVLCLFATWKEESVAQLRELEGLHAKIKNERMTVLGVALDADGPAAVKGLLERESISFPVFTNGAAIVADLGGVRKLPTTYVLLREGHIYHKVIGFERARRIEDVIGMIRAQRL